MNENKSFNVGDNVICTDTTLNSTGEVYVSRLVKGQRYVVTGIRVRGSTSSVKLEGLGETTFRSFRFTKTDDSIITTEISVGASVIFLRDANLRNPDRFTVAEIRGDQARLEKRQFWIDLSDLKCMSSC